MSKSGQIIISISGSKGNIELNPDNYDIKEIMLVLESAEYLLFPNDRKDRPLISYKIEEGSVKNVFKTTLQYIIGFNAILGQINQLNNIDFLDFSTANAIEQFQGIAIKKNYNFVISTSIADSNELIINKETNLFRTESAWADAEFYFYGKITNMGGKDKANIHLVTDELGTVIIQTPKTDLERIENNLLYKNFGVRATGKQRLDTGEIDKHSLKFIEIINYQPKYDGTYLETLRKKAMNSWLSSINSEEWLKNMREGYES